MVMVFQMAKLWFRRCGYPALFFGFEKVMQKIKNKWTDASNVLLLSFYFIQSNNLATVHMYFVYILCHCLKLFGNYTPLQGLLCKHFSQNGLDLNALRTKHLNNGMCKSKNPRWGGGGG